MAANDSRGNNRGNKGSFCIYATGALPQTYVNRRIGDTDVGDTEVIDALRFFIVGGLIMGKQEYARPYRPQAGMLFFNDEGLENGGLIFNGGLVNGKPTNGGSLTFDRYHQDQTLQLLSVENGSERFAGLYVNDQPNPPAAFNLLPQIMAMPDGPAKQAAFESAHMGGTQRAFLGCGPDKASQLVLRDGQGRKRLVLRVTEGGDATIEFLDAAGKVVRTVR